MKLEKLEKLRIPSASGKGIYLTSLRPGDWLRGFSGALICIYVNSPVLERALIGYDGGVYGRKMVKHQELINATYLGRGKERKWREYFPAFIRRKINKYAQPNK